MYYNFNIFLGVYVNKIILGGIVKRGFSLVIQTHAKIMENATPLMIIHFNVVVLKVRLLNLNFLSLKNLGVHPRLDLVNLDLVKSSIL